MINLFIPNKNNNYHPLLLRKWMLSVYLVFLILFNIIFGGINLVISNAALDFSTLYQLHNEERAKNNLPPLSINNLLINSATAKAKAMLASNCWAHYCPDGKSPWDFFDQAGYYYLYAGENLAEGFADNQAVMTAWMNSPTHRENILNKNFTEMGIGFATGDYQGIANNTIVVVHFGSRLVQDTNTFIPTIEPTGNTQQHNITITAPANGASLPSESFNISGTYNALDEIQFKANETTLGKVPVTGNNFTFRNTLSPMAEGNYVLTAQGFSKGQQIADSNLVNIMIDKTAPELVKEKLNVLETQQNNITSYTLTFTDLDAQSVKVTNLNKDFQLSGRNSWELTLSKSDLDSQSSLVFLATDLAGNQTKLELTSATIISLSNGNSVLSFNPNTSSLLRFVLPQTPKAQINFSFALFLSALFGIDYFVLAKTGMTNVKRSSSHLNFTILILTVLLFLSSNSLGNILTGIATK
jgi:hypothetical protein